MIVRLQINDREFEVELHEPIDISIPVMFNGPQPSAYGVEPAASEACRSGEMVGDTRLGGSINFERYTLIPHCNGTHTECVGHITNERISIRDCLQDVLIPAILISVQPERSGESDHLITGSMIETAISDSEAYLANRGALIVRTLPNDDSKLTRRYGSEIPPYFTTEAMEYIVSCGFKHLLVDVPSIDRIFDEGKLINHRVFWNIEPGSFETTPAARLHSTITELIYVPNSVKDGEYLLNLQIAPFEADAAPSRPIITRLVDSRTFVDG